MAFAWLAGLVYNTALVFVTSGVIDGVCYAAILYTSSVDLVVSMTWYIVSYYVIIIFIFIFCYGRILGIVRRQASVMASHSAGAGPSTSQNQLNQIKSNVIKTMIMVSAFFAAAWLPINVYYQPSK